MTRTELTAATWEMVTWRKAGTVETSFHGDRAHTIEDGRIIGYSNCKQVYGQPWVGFRCGYLGADYQYHQPVSKAATGTVEELKALVARRLELEAQYAPK